jgi:hypothetical protein
MTNSKPMLVLAVLIASTLIPTSRWMAHETITLLITKGVAGPPGEQVLMCTVDFPPGISSPIRRRNAQMSV